MQTLQTLCNQQVLHIYDELEEVYIDITTFPITPPDIGAAGWYIVTQTGPPDTTLRYRDDTDTTYIYYIDINYDTLGQGTCISNPVRDCSCIIVTRTDKSGVYVDDIVPDYVIGNALNSLSAYSTEECDVEEEDLFTNLNRKRVNTSKIPFVANKATITVDGWYRTIDTYSGRTITVYIDKSTDPDNDYEIDIDTDNEISSCTDINSEKRDKSGYPTPDRTIPYSIKAKAISTLPMLSTSCGTGFWNGCSFLNIPNYFIIGGGVAAITIFYLTKK